MESGHPVGGGHWAPLSYVAIVACLLPGNGTLWPMSAECHLQVRPSGGRGDVSAWGGGPATSTTSLALEYGPSGREVHQQMKGRSLGVLNAQLSQVWETECQREKGGFPRVTQSGLSWKWDPTKPQTSALFSTVSAHKQLTGTKEGKEGWVGMGAARPRMSRSPAIKAMLALTGVLVQTSRNVIPLN